MPSWWSCFSINNKRNGNRTKCRTSGCNNITDQERATDHRKRLQRLREYPRTAAESFQTFNELDRTDHGHSRTGAQPLETPDERVRSAHDLSLKSPNHENQVR